jgi:hypothetical protein
MNVGFRFLDGKRDWGWVNQQTNILRVEDTTGIVAVNSDTGELLACCVLDNWKANAVNGHFIILNPIVIRHGFLKKIVDYVYTDRDKRIIIGLVAESNKKALRLNKHFGFEQIARIEDVFLDGSAYIIMVLEREHALAHSHIKRLGEK